MKNISAFVFMLFPVLGALFFLQSEPVAAKTKKTLELPRYVTIVSGEANLRSGPGLVYEKKWLYVRRNIPVKVIGEYEEWRKIQDYDGEEGWMHRSMLSNKRTVLVTGKVRVMRRHPSSDAAPVARVEAGVNAKLLECTPDYCRIQVDNYKGWVNRRHIWGIKNTEWMQ